MDHLDKLIRLAISEDVGPGDITSKATVSSALRSNARIVAKETLILAGMDAARRTFLRIDPKVKWKALRKDGQRCRKGDIIAKLSGPARALLAGERTALNFLQRLSGIATETRRFVDAMGRTRTKLLDTRKTAPGFRALEKHAVKMGGGANHRAGLCDAFLIKNNHIAAAGGIAKAMALAKQRRKRGQVIEVETGTIADVAAALASGADVIMLDNMSIPEMKFAIRMAARNAKTEISGNVTLQRMRALAKLGADFISSGAITHSAPAADIHMLIEISV